MTPTSGNIAVVATVPPVLPASGTASNTPDQFNAAYFAAQPMDVQLALKIADFGQRSLALQELAQTGRIIDEEIMIDGWSPYSTMWARHKYGYTWVESVGQHLIDLPPGFFGAGRTTYNPNPPYPAGTIAVPDPDTCDLSVWYPPTVKPAVPLSTAPASTPAGPYVGALWPDVAVTIGRPAYHCTAAGELVPVGFETEETGAKLIRGRYWTFATTLTYFAPPA